MFLEGDSEIASLIKRKDWAASPLGSINYWPVSLLSTLDLLLNSAFPMFLFWGREATCFYNDAFRPILGEEGKHPSALGSTGETVWAEVWPSIKPLIDQAFNGQATRLYKDLCLPIYRNGKLEDAWWTFSYSPIRTAEGEVQGVLAICNETTQKIQEHQASEDIRQQLHFALDACELGTWNLDPQTMVFQCNEKTKEIFGLPRAFQVNLQTAVDVIHPDDRQKVQTAINAAFDPQLGGRYSVEYTVVHPVNGSHSIVSAKGKAYFDEKGKPVKFTGTLQDITRERQASRRQEKLQQLIERSKDFMAMATLDGQMTYLNAAGRAMVGIGAADDLSVLRIKDFYSDAQFETISHEIIPALQAAGQWSGLIRIRHLQTGEEIPCHADYILIRDPVSGNIISRGVTLRDLRPQLQAQQELEESEKRFRNLVQEAPVATAIYTGRNMQIQWANDAMIRLWGKDKTVIGLTVRQALPELEGQPFHTLLDQVYTTGEIYQASEDKCELVVNGQLQTFYFNFSYKPLRDAAGEVYGLLNMAIDVTEQVKTKRCLEESEKNFRNLIMQAPVGICLLTGDDNHFEIANEEYLELVGRKPEEIQYKPVWEVLPEAKEQGFDVLLNNVKETGQPYVGYEQPIELLRNGQPEVVYINFVYEPLFDDNKGVHSILVIAIDITQQVKARHAIEDAEERARLAVESAKLGTYELDLKTGAMIGSLRFNELFDADTDHLHPDYVSKIHPDDSEIRRQAHEQAGKTGRLQYEARIIRQDGTLAWLQIFGQLYFDEQQQPFKIIGIVQDVTQQKIADEEREKFLALSQYSRDFIAMFDMTFKTLYVNKAGLDMLGINEEAEQACIWDYFYPEDHAFLTGRFFPSVQKERHGEVEIRFRHFKTGAPVWVIYSVVLIHDSKGQPSIMATVSRDITERKNMENELERRVKERTAELEKLNHELQQFTYVSSHDLKEPLRKIQMFGNLAMQQADTTSDKLKESLGKIVHSASRMSTLLTDLLNYSLLTNTDYRFVKVDLNRVLHNVEEDTELLIREKGAIIHSAPLPVIDGIPFQLSQLFFNLLGNALKFSKDGVPPEITINCMPFSEDEKAAYTSLLPVPYIKITISDNGIGFKPEFVKKIFVVFQRLNDRGVFAGNGIGLSLCKKIVENHHGEIFATSEPGVGSVFTVLLPQTQP